MDASDVLFPICNGFHGRLLTVRPYRNTIEYFDQIYWLKRREMHPETSRLAYHRSKTAFQEDEGGCSEAGQ